MNWNAGEQLRDCLRSIEDVGKGAFRLDSVIIVDNGSHDRSARELESTQVPLTIIENGENRGFAAGCNQGAREGLADYILFLNPDTELFEESLNSPIRCLEETAHSRIAICGIQLVNRAGDPMQTCARFPQARTFFFGMLGLDKLFPKYCCSLFLTLAEHRKTREVDQVSGAFFLIRRRVFESLCGFDERFFVYFEELDLSYRARQEGWKTLFLTEARAYHRGWGTSDHVKATRLFYNLRSRVLYAFKHFGRLSAASVAFGTLVVEPVTRLLRAAIGLSTSRMIETVHGYLLLWRALPSMWIGAQRVKGA